MIFEIIEFAINMVFITVFATIFMEAQSTYTIKCIYLIVRLREEEKPKIK